MSYPYGGDQLYPPPPGKIGGHNPADSADNQYSQNTADYPYLPQSYPEYPTYHATYPNSQYPTTNLGPPGSIPPVTQPSVTRFEEISIDQKLPPPSQPGAGAAPGVRASYTDNADDHCMCLLLGSFVLGFLFPIVWLIAAILPCCVAEKQKGAALWLWIANMVMGILALVASLLVVVQLRDNIW